MSIFTIEAIAILAIAILIALNIELQKPKPHPVGLGDTLMVRRLGYGFCPYNCNVDHFHIGHFKNYNCKEDTCTHITINQD